MTIETFSNLVLEIFSKTFFSTRKMAQFDSLNHIKNKQQIQKTKAVEQKVVTFLNEML